MELANCIGQTLIGTTVSVDLMYTTSSVDPIETGCSSACFVILVNVITRNYREGSYSYLRSLYHLLFQCYFNTESL